MTSRTRILSIVAMLGLFVVSSSIAEAGRRGGGRLSKVGGGLRARSSAASGRARGPSSSGLHSSRHGRSYGYGTSRPYGVGALSAIVLPPIEVDLYAGAQKLVESDKAVTFDAVLRMGDIGLATRFTQFREPAADLSMSTLTLDLWSLGASYRFRVSADIELEPELGVAGLRYAGDGQMPLTDLGGVAGLGMRVRFGTQAALVGSGRFFVMGETGTAIEGRAGIAVGPLQLAYRAVKFDAGPALEGPEVGLGFRF